MFFGNVALRNLLVSAVTAVVFAALAATGLAMEFLFNGPAREPASGDGPQLEHGQQWRGGAARSAGDMSTDGAKAQNSRGDGRRWRGGPIVLGLRKHDCEEIHEWLSLTFVGLVALHLLLHAKWIWSVSRGCDPRWQRVRAALLLTFAGLLTGLMLLPLTLAIAR